MRYFLLIFLSFLLATPFTVWVYQPIYQKLPLTDSISDINSEIKRLDFPLGEVIQEIMGNFFPLPSNRHKICLLNNNYFYLIHADNQSTGYEFRTQDISRGEDGRKMEAGAMAIELYYSGELEKDQIYTRPGEPKKCEILRREKLFHYASSTLLYRSLRLSEELKLDNLGKLLIKRIVADSYTDTANSTATIETRWSFFWITLAVIAYALYKLLSALHKKTLKMLSRHGGSNLDLASDDNQEETDVETI